jgi:hypothetical protein
VMNLLAVAATFGVLTAFFQWGWGTEAFDLGKAGPIEAYLPVLTLAILFGLSMDYQVFLISRMNEDWVHRRDNQRAVRVGQVETARVITAAATIMICVFLTFSFFGQRDIAEFGIGLAAAVALDAFLLRTILVPALMHMFGDANWWLPRWLDRRLPHLAIEPPAPAPAQPPRSSQEQELTERGRLAPQAEHHHHSTGIRQTDDGWIIDGELTPHSSKSQPRARDDTYGQAPGPGRTARDALPD